MPAYLLTPNAIRSMVMGDHAAAEGNDTNAARTNHHQRSRHHQSHHPTHNYHVPLLVKILIPSRNELRLYDGVDSVNAVVLKNSTSTAAMLKILPAPGKICISGYVVSEIQDNVAEPVVFIAQYKQIQRDSTDTPIPQHQAVQIPRSRVQGGKVPVFLEVWAPILTNESLAGMDAYGRMDHERVELESRQRDVSAFLEHHAAIRTLHRSSTTAAEHTMSVATSTGGAASNGDLEPPPPPPHGKATAESYMAVLEDFQTAQLKRQNASLVSNSGREDAVRSSLVESQHNQALLLALSKYNANPMSTPLSSSSSSVTSKFAFAVPPADSRNNKGHDGMILTVETLCQWHAVLCGGGLHDEAGVLRTRNVRAGDTAFRPYAHVATDLEITFRALRELQVRLLGPVVHGNHHHTGSPAMAAAPDHSLGALPNTNRGLLAATFAAAVFMGIVDVHAFADGNGRLARIAVNWALQRAGVPFVIHLFATPTQRDEYTTAIRKTRRNICLIARGQVSQESFVEAYERAGALGPLVNLILDRLSKAFGEFNKLVHERSMLDSEEAEERAARKSRERAANGNCLICFEEKPNIATLCCGKAIHLNCMAQWLSSRNSCPQCRAEHPELSPRIRTPPASDAAAGGGGNNPMIDDTTYSSTSFLDTTFDEDEADMTAETGSTDSNRISNELHAQLLVALLGHAAARRRNRNADNEDTGEESELDGADDTVNDDDDNMDDEEDDTVEDDTVEEVHVREHHPPFCIFDNCRNRAARDCTNLACGRCCIMHFTSVCGRHPG